MCLDILENVFLLFQLYYNSTALPNKVVTSNLVICTPFHDGLQGNRLLHQLQFERYLSLCTAEHMRVCSCTASQKQMLLYPRSICTVKSPKHHMHLRSCLPTTVRSVRGSNSSRQSCEANLCNSGPALGKRTTCLWRQMQQIRGQPLDDRHTLLLGQVTTARLI